MITCIFGLTACGSEETFDYDKALIESNINMLYSLTASDYQEADLVEIKKLDEYEWSALEQVWRQSSIKVTGKVIIGGIETWIKAKDELGKVEGIIGYEYDEANKDGIIVNAVVKGTDHDAKIEFIFDENMNVTGITTNVQYSFGEQMQKAGLNTLLGMGTVFAVLILISLIIACFSYIPKLQQKFSKKETREEIKAVAVENTIAQIIEKEELSDDLELVAVISAAIAASEGAVSTDGFVVRSIKRANTNKWQRA